MANGKWHSVLRRLPDANQILLVHVPSANEPIWLAYYDDEAEEWVWPTGGTVTGVVTHWMELPEAPGATP